MLKPVNRTTGYIKACQVAAGSRDSLRNRSIAKADFQNVLASKITERNELLQVGIKSKEPMIVFLQGDGIIVDQPKPFGRYRPAHLIAEFLVSLVDRGLVRHLAYPA
jgi:hypothetical protein